MVMKMLATWSHKEWTTCISSESILSNWGSDKGRKKKHKSW